MNDTIDTTMDGIRKRPRPLTTSGIGVVPGQDEAGTGAEERLGDDVPTCPEAVAGEAQADELDRFAAGDERDEERKGDERHDDGEPADGLAEAVAGHGQEAHDDHPIDGKRPHRLARRCGNTDREQECGGDLGLRGQCVNR